MKKWLAIGLGCVLIFQSNTYLARAESLENNIYAEKITTSVQNEKIKTVMDYGIIKGDPDGNLRFKDNITRAEAVTILIRANSEYNEEYRNLLCVNYFDDIENHWALKEIVFACEKEIINGLEEKKFMPEENVKVCDFVKMLISILGYKEMAEAKGGYPHGYIQLGIALGLLDNINEKTTDNVTRESAAIMIAQSLDIPLMRIKENNENDIEYVICDGENAELKTLRILLENK